MLVNARTRGKIILLISRFAQNTGAGGHYYSYQALADALGSDFDIHLMAIGTELPPALEGIRERVDFLTALPGPKGRRVLERHLAETGRPDCFIALDQTSAMLLRRYCRRTATGLVLVKAGGSWPKRYFPNINVQVHFSLKDHRRVEARKLPQQGRSFYIPNRVTPVAPQAPDAEALRRELKLDDDEVVILRIGRVSNVYRAAFEGTLALRRVISEAGYKARAVMIGTPESAELTAELSALCEPGRDHLLTDLDHTRSASRYLPVAQINVGVGRGFMEGASLGQYMFAIANNGGLPVRVDDETIATFMEENISMRVQLERSEGRRRRDIISAVQSIKAGLPHDAHARVWFDTWFSAERIPELYGQAIETAQALPEMRGKDYFFSEFWLRVAPIEERVRVARKTLGAWHG